METQNDTNTENKKSANEMTFLEHLEEMRGVLLKSLAVFVVAFCIVMVGFYYFNKLMLFPLNKAKDLLVTLYGANQQVEKTLPQQKMGPVYLVEEKDGKEIGKKGPYYIIAEDKNVVLSQENSSQKNAHPDWVSDIKLRSMSITTPIFVWMSVGFLGSLGLSLPAIMFFIARFVMPGLTKQELKMLAPGVILGTILFFIGAIFAFAFMLPMGIAFMAYMAQGMQLEMFPDAMSYYSMVIFVTIATGLTFELPLLEFILIYLGVLDVEWLKNNRRMVFLIILIFATVVTPPDCITQISLTIPLYLLYEIALRVGIVMRKRKLAREKAQEEIEEAEAEREHKQYVQEEAKRRLAEQEAEENALPEKDSANEDDYYNEYEDRAYDELDNLEDEYNPDDDYGLENYYDDYESPEGYINYGSLAKPMPDFTPDWSLNDPDTSFMSPDWSLNESEQTADNSQDIPTEKSEDVEKDKESENTSNVQ
ncbi:MAG: hypothetical protein E7035_09650 [Verrucomicrobiaceae bacterium]|nr:hypothetical protein [Verrucomicrobiaceae bacterium]